LNQFHVIIIISRKYGTITLSAVLLTNTIHAQTQNKTTTTYFMLTTTGCLSFVVDLKDGQPEEFTASTLRIGGYHSYQHY